MSRKNYTEREKKELLTIVDKYKTIIENKSTNAVTIEKKNEAWEKIAQEYNSSAENPRTAKQLNTAYQNLKRLTRQKTAEDNKQNYMEKKSQCDLKSLKKAKAEDKKAIMATGGGTFIPQLSEVGAQMLALMGDQLRPLSNNCDSATNYFCDKDENKTANDENCNENNKDVIIDIIQEFDNHENDVSMELPLEEIEITEEPPVEEKRPPKLQKKKINSLSSRPCSSHSRNIHLKKKKNIETTTSIKRKFYQKKLECALLEKRTQLINYKISMKKEKLIDLEIKIKELEYSSKTNSM